MSATDPIRHWEQVFAGQEPPGDAPWLSTLRAEAFEAFAAEGFPRPRSQGWRHTNMTGLARVPFEIGGGAGALDPATLPALEGAGARLVFVDGRLRDDLSERGGDGVTAHTLREALAAGDADLRAHLGEDPASPNGPFAALNTALMEDGAVVRVARGTTPAPIHLVFVTTGDGAPTATILRNLVLVEDLAEATVVEHHLGHGGPTSFTNVVTEVVCGPGSAVVHARLQEEGAEAWHVGDVHATVARDARFTSLSLALGALLSRTGIHVVLDGEGAECDLLGLYLGRGKQHHDHTTLIEHARPHGTSREVYKGILDGQARGVFTGMVRVAPDAQKTDAQQSNRNLLLSDGAHADSEPMLEIHADDVKCSHGSAIGRLDDDALFYLRARGIDLRQAQRLLTRAFAAEVVDTLPEGGLKALVAARVATWLDDAHFGREP